MWYAVRAEGMGVYIYNFCVRINHNIQVYIYIYLLIQGFIMVITWYHCWLHIRLFSNQYTLHSDEGFTLYLYTFSTCHYIVLITWWYLTGGMWIKVAVCKQSLMFLWRKGNIWIGISEAAVQINSNFYRKMCHHINQTESNRQVSARSWKRWIHLIKDTKWPMWHWNECIAGRK